MKRAMRVAQQFGQEAGDLLRRRLSRAEIVDTGFGPDGWLPDVEVLLSGPARAWTGKTKPDGWPGALQWIQLPGTGSDGYPDWMFDVAQVTTAPGLNAGAIAEFVLACMLAHEKRLPECWINHASEWRPRPLGSLNGKTLGIAGLGAIGTACARHAIQFGMDVVALRRTKAPPMEGVRLVTDRLELASLSDHLVLCLPSTRETRHFVDAAFLEACRRQLHLVNVARGDLIDQSELIRALDENLIEAASLDVATPEPLPLGHRLYSHPSVRLSPHVAFSSPRTMRNLIDYFSGQFESFEQEQPLRNIAHL